MTVALQRGHDKRFRNGFIFSSPQSNNLSTDTRILTNDKLLKKTPNNPKTKRRFSNSMQLGIFRVGPD